MLRAAVACAAPSLRLRAGCAARRALVHTDALPPRRAVAADAEEAEEEEDLDEDGLPRVRSVQYKFNKRVRGLSSAKRERERERGADVGRRGGRGGGRGASRSATLWTCSSSTSRRATAGTVRSASIEEARERERERELKNRKGRREREREREMQHREKGRGERESV